MTPQEIVSAVSAVAGKYSLMTFYRDAKEFGIEPTPHRTRPRQYPNTAAAVILSKRGFETALMPLATFDMASKRLDAITKAERHPTMPELRSIKKKARAAR